jgi:hypothetical protein
MFGFIFLSVHVLYQYQILYAIPFYNCRVRVAGCAVWPLGFCFS